jgi:COP9 signalosome complex subunit 1
MDTLRWVSHMNKLHSLCMTVTESYLCVCMLLQDNLLLDMYIAPHVNALYTQIRNRALIQYFSPYLSADMRKMAAAFNTTVLALEDELMQLILDGQIQARIDSHNKVHYLLIF